jgi:hypothetical protein
MRNCEQETAPYFGVLCPFSCNCYHHIIIFILITTVVKAITPQRDGVSPLEAHSHGYDYDERHAKQFPRRKTEYYGLKLCGSSGAFLHEENSNLLSLLQYILYYLSFSISVTFAKSFECFLITVSYVTVVLMRTYRKFLRCLYFRSLLLTLKRSAFFEERKKSVFFKTEFNFFRRWAQNLEQGDEM